MQMNIPILFVVHRYAPYPGGSEMYVQWMAEEMLSRFYDVTVLAHEHMGDLNGVKVTNDYNVLLDPKSKMGVDCGTWGWLYFTRCCPCECSTDS
jgi:hypothetical protein